MEQVTGLEPVPSAWQAEILTDYTIPAFMEPIVRFERTWTFVSWLQITCNRPLCDIGIFKKGKEFGEQFQSHASSMELHNLVYPYRQPSRIHRVRSWSSECSIGEAGIVFT